MARIILDRAESDYIRMLIDSGDNARIKRALQRLSMSYWRGLKIHPSQLNGVVNSLVGTAFRASIDEKVRRWLLNSLGRVGDESTCLPVVLRLIYNHTEEPQTVAAGIAAVYKLCNKSDPSDVLSGINFDPQMRTLAALQHIPASKLDLRSLPIDIERASSDILKLALITVGLDKSPDNLFNPKHNNAEMVKVLGTHNDALVSQYSIWAILENRKLNLQHLGINLQDIESQPDNVRGWLFQLLAVEASKDQPYWEYIRLGMIDRSIEARRGLAIGLRNNFIDVFEPLILDWVTSEQDAEVHQYLIEHIVQQAQRSASYYDYAIGIYEGEPANSLLRSTMEASAVRMPIYTEFKRISTSEPNLFGGNTMVNNITIGNINAGAVAIDGSTAINHGALSNQALTKQQIDFAQSELAKLEVAVHDLKEINGELLSNILRCISDAKQDPSPGKLKQVIDVVGHAATLVDSAKTLAPYATALGAFLGF